MEAGDVGSNPTLVSAIQCSVSYKICLHKNFVIDQKGETIVKQTIKRLLSKRRPTPSSNPRDDACAMFVFAYFVRFACGYAWWLTVLSIFLYSLKLLGFTAPFVQEFEFNDPKIALTAVVLHGGLSLASHSFAILKKVIDAISVMCNTKRRTTR